MLALTFVNMQNHTVCFVVYRAPLFTIAWNNKVMNLFVSKYLLVVRRSCGLIFKINTAAFLCCLLCFFIFVVAASSLGSTSFTSPCCFLASFHSNAVFNPCFFGISNRSATPSPSKTSGSRAGRDRFAGESYTVLGMKP